MASEDFRKKSLRRGLRISPTPQYWELYAGIEDYKLKERITLVVNHSGMNQLPGSILREYDINSRVVGQPLVFTL